jgi:hypothetical protein
MSTNERDIITMAADALQRDVEASQGQFERCRKAGNDLAAAIRNLPESDVKTALYPAYEAFMQQDAGNFGPPAPWADGCVGEHSPALPTCEMAPDGS